MNTARALKRIQPSSVLSWDKGGFSMVELVVVVAIIGILGSIAWPQYFHQVQKTRQNEASTNLSQIQVTIAAFVDEMGILPKSWADLNKITPLMTPSGPADNQDFEWITLSSANCNARQSNSESVVEEIDTNCYQVTVSESNQIYTVRAKSKNPDAATYNVIACLDLRTGASDLKKGNQANAISAGDLQCVRQGT